jgi:transposase
MLAEGQPYRTIKTALGCNEHYISRWKSRFLTERLAGLYSRYPGRTPTTRTAQMEARIFGVDAAQADGWVDSLEHPKIGKHCTPG